MGLAPLGVRGAGDPVRSGTSPGDGFRERTDLGRRASRPSGPCREPLDGQDFEAQVASARMTIGELPATTPYSDEVEWAGRLPLTDPELDDAIVRLVRLCPGRSAGRGSLTSSPAIGAGRSGPSTPTPGLRARSVPVARAGAPPSRATAANGPARATRRQPAAPGARRRRQVAAEARPLSTAVNDVSAETRR